MTKFAVIMAELGFVEKEGQTYPCVILIGRDEQLKRVKYRVKYFPYFYLNEEDYLKIKDTPIYQGWHVQSVEGTTARGLTKGLLTKISVTDAGRISDTIKCINKWNKQLETREETLFTYEADLSRSDLLPLRYMIDKGIRSGVDIAPNGDITPIDFQVPLRKWYIDFEAYSDRMGSYALNPMDPIIMVSVWDSYSKKLYTFYVDNKKLVEPKPLFDEHIITSYSTEAKLLDALVALIQEHDPDLIIAWNLNRYDMDKWKQRMDLNKDCIRDFADISPMGSILWQGRPHRVKGRVLFDLMVAFKQFTDAELDSYSLQYVTENEKLGYDKVPFVGSAAYTWDNYPETMFKRNSLDVMIIKALDDKYGLVDTYDDMRVEFGCLFHETFVRNRVIDTALMRFVNGKVALRTSEYGKTKEDDRLLGAVVKEPKPSEYTYVAQFDFGREYPNIIKGFNISPETYREKKPKAPHFTVKYRDMIFYFVKNPIGLLPQLINYFFKKRDDYDKEQRAAIARGANDAEVKKWDRRQYNVKKTTNAIYGVMDYNRFRLHKKECTQAVAVIGRISIEELMKYSESISYNMLYGDTDSIFIQLKNTNPEEALKEAKSLQDNINNHLAEYFVEQYGVDKAPADMGLKRIYDNIMFIGKKNYAGLYIWDEKSGYKEGFDIKGIASVRSDSSNLEKTTIENLLKLILKREKDPVIDAFIKNVLKDYDARHYNYLDISYPAQIKQKLYYDLKKNKWMTGYDIQKLPAHIKAAIYSNTYINTGFGSEDKPRRLPIRFKGKLAVEQGQQSLMVEKIFPTQWEYEGKKYRLTDISVAEDMVVPSFFLNNIDWERIRERLVNKINMVVSIHKKGTEEKGLKGSMSI